MPRRQLAVFIVGCWAALVLAALQVFAHAAGWHPPVAMLPAWVAELVGGTPISLPAGAERTLFDVLSGFSLVLSLLLATWGGIGLAVSRRGETDGPLVYAVARVMAGGAVVLLVLSLVFWGIGPSIPLALLAVSFTLAAVRAPGF